MNQQLRAQNEWLCAMLTNRAGGLELYRLGMENLSLKQSLQNLVAHNTVGHVSVPVAAAPPGMTVGAISPLALGGCCGLHGGFHGGLMPAVTFAGAGAAAAAATAATAAT